MVRVLAPWLHAVFRRDTPTIWRKLPINLDQTAQVSPSSTVRISYM
jgi:hypothetical protein